ncbi:MAG: hypothetical protein KF764_05815 [Labilithrix sp.]|nr:hypothetical protein [Labilithrix sp.]
MTNDRARSHRGAPGKLRRVGAPLTLAVMLAASSALAADAGVANPHAASDPHAGVANPHAAGDPHAGVANPHAAGDPHAGVANPHGAGDPHAAGANPHAAGANPHGADGDDEAADGNPHGNAGHGRGADNGMFQPPEDGAMDDPTLPVGTLELHIVDPSGKPLPNTTVTLGVLYNSVAKGESRKRLSLTTNATGTARLDELETGSTVAYRPMVITDGATFSVMPFRMPEKTGMRAVLHVYPVVDSIEQALVVSQSVIYTEVKDDRIQVQQAFKIYNFGKNAWVPKDLVVPLPETFTAFTTQQGMSDVGVDAVPNKGVRIHGTFGPGQHMLEFRWQLPYSGEAEVRFDVGMPPRMAASRVIAPASKDMTLEVPDFPPPQSTSDGMGQRALITEKQLRKEDAALSAVTIVIRGLPTEGPAKVIATLLAGGGLVLGLVLGAKSPSSRDRKRERQRLLDELEELERAHMAEDIGPKTYERARRELLDALTRTFADEPTSKPRARTDVRPRAS